MHDTAITDKKIQVIGRILKSIGTSSSRNFEQMSSIGIELYVTMYAVAIDGSNNQRLIVPRRELSLWPKFTVLNVLW